jgi:uncharacterized RDD family membrane protein YckC
MNEISSPDKTAYVGLLRRLFAIFYDGFLLIAILFIVTAIATAFNHGKAIETSDTFYPLYVIVVFGLSYLYFAWFWIHGGQSLGMKTWRAQLRTTSNNKIGWGTAAIRYVSALLSWGFCGMGFLWALFDKKNRCWHELICNT